MATAPNPKVWGPVPEIQKPPNLQEWKNKLIGKKIIPLRVKLKDPKKEFAEYDIGKLGIIYMVVGRNQVVKDSNPNRLQIHIDQYRVCTDCTVG